MTHILTVMTEASTLPLGFSVLGGDIGALFYDLIAGTWAAFDPDPPSGP